MFIDVGYWLGLEMYKAVARILAICTKFFIVSVAEILVRLKPYR